MYPDTRLFIGGVWTGSRSGRTLPVVNPATEEEIGKVAHAGTEDLEAAVEAADKGFRTWRRTSPLVRSDTLRRAAALLRERAGAIAAVMTAEQGKPIAEARAELAASSEILEWCAEEARRTYGRIVPARVAGVSQLVLKEPVGPVAAFTPWNFPVSQAARKIGAALAAGCSVIIKPPEETPASPAALAKALEDAGLPAGVLNLVYGVPAEISEFLIASPVIRKISFTGSTVVGKHLAALAGSHMKRTTMELGGHAPSMVFADADLDKAVAVLAGSKFRNAGQICISPTRFFVQDAIYDDFVAAFTTRAAAIKVGDGMAAGTMMGPLANARRLAAMDGFVDDARTRGATVTTGGERIGNRGYFYGPTVIKDAPDDSLVMTEEPFGPMAPMTRFATIEEVAERANALDLGLASYAVTNSLERASRIGEVLAAGMVGINTVGVASPETPFGGVKESGYGVESGPESLEHYLVPKSIALKPYL